MGTVDGLTSCPVCGMPCSFMSMYHSGGITYSCDVCGVLAGKVIDYEAPSICDSLFIDFDRYYRRVEHGYGVIKYRSHSDGKGHLVSGGLYRKKYWDDNATKDELGYVEYETFYKDILVIRNKYGFLRDCRMFKPYKDEQGDDWLVGTSSDTMLMRDCLHYCKPHTDIFTVSDNYKNAYKKVYEDFPWMSWSSSGEALRLVVDRLRKEDEKKHDAPPSKSDIEARMRTNFNKMIEDKDVMPEVTRRICSKKAKDIVKYGNDIVEMYNKVSDEFGKVHEQIATLSEDEQIRILFESGVAPCIPVRFI